MNEMIRLYHLIASHYTEPDEEEHLSKSRSILIETILEQHLDRINIESLNDQAQDALHNLLEAFATLYRSDFAERASQYRFIYNKMIDLHAVCPACRPRRTSFHFPNITPDYANSFGHPHSTRKNKSKSPLLSKA